MSQTLIDIRNNKLVEERREQEEQYKRDSKLRKEREIEANKCCKVLNKKLIDWFDGFYDKFVKEDEWLFMVDNIKKHIENQSETSKITLVKYCNEIKPIYPLPVGVINSTVYSWIKNRHTIRKRINKKGSIINKAYIELRINGDPFEFEFIIDLTYENTQCIFM